MDSSMYERMPVHVYRDAGTASKYVAGQIADLLRHKAEQGEYAVLGLATGSTPTRVYDELIRLHREEGLSFEHVVTFNLDEYYPMQPDAAQSYVRFMHESLFDHVNIKPEHIHIPDGTLRPDEVPEYCAAYEQKIVDYGGMDLQLLGIGRTGHVGFNEPGSVRKTRTRLVTLDQVTRNDAAGDFYGKENVPHQAITMGIASIMEARKVVLMAWGEHKASIIARAVEGKISDRVPATFLQEHDNVEVILDEASSTELTRRRSPWLVRSCEWNDALIKKAVVWLSKKLGKPVLKLTDEDYSENGLSELVTKVNSAYDINIRVFNQIQHSITGWPGGKPDADDTRRPERAAPFPKRVLVFSPHPDDDVFSMGGTLMRLVEQGHEVHVAYQTSGSNGVYDEEALRFADFVKKYQEAMGLSSNKARQVYRKVLDHLGQRAPGDPESEELRLIKRLIRAGEARAACRYIGVALERVHFLNMPFYETGRIRKKPLSEADVQLVTSVLQKVKPHQVYAAGDLLDPHGTHRLCLDAVREALYGLRDEAWFEDCYFWLYRGTWQEWKIHEIEMAVPLSPGELNKKRNAIFKHESQKDYPLYPGNDTREFWERADEQTRSTAAAYDALGLAEYEAIEGFVRWNILNN